MFYVLWKAAVHFLECVNKHFKPTPCLKMFTNRADDVLVHNKHVESLGVLLFDQQVATDARSFFSRLPATRRG